MTQTVAQLDEEDEEDELRLEPVCMKTMQFVTSVFVCCVVMFIL